MFFVCASTVETITSDLRSIKGIGHSEKDWEDTLDWLSEKPIQSGEDMC